MSRYGFEYDDRRGEPCIDYTEAWEELNATDGVSFVDLLDTHDLKVRMDEIIDKVVRKNLSAAEALSHLVEDAIQARLFWMAEEDCP